MSAYCHVYTNYMGATSFINNINSLVGIQNAISIAMKTNLLLFASLSLCTLTLFAKPTSVAANRFELRINAVQKAISTSYSKAGFKDLSETEQAEALIKGGLRLAAFNLQSLGRMYQDHPNTKVQKFAIDLRDQTKAIEDRLGKVDMYKNVDKPDDEKKAAKKIMKTLRENNWVSESGKPGAIFGKIKTSISTITWPSNEEDRLFVLQTLSDQISSVHKTKYDMSLLNAGLHELRRELRWITFYALSSDGLLKKSENTCPLKSTPLTEFADPKYSSLDSKPISGSCYMSACVYDEIAGAVGIFGKIKDRGEQIAEHDEDMLKADLAPEEIQLESKRYYRLLKETKALDYALKQLASCINKK